MILNMSGGGLPNYTTLSVQNATAAGGVKVNYMEKSAARRTVVDVSTSRQDISVPNGIDLEQGLFITLKQSYLDEIGIFPSTMYGDTMILGFN